MMSEFCGSLRKNRGGVWFCQLLRDAQKDDREGQLLLGTFMVGFLMLLSKLTVFVDNREECRSVHLYKKSPGYAMHCRHLGGLRDH